MTGHAFSGLPVLVLVLAISCWTTLLVQARVQQGEYEVPSYLARYMADRGGSLSRQTRDSVKSEAAESAADTKEPNSFDEIDRGVWGDLAENPFNRSPQSTTHAPRPARALDGQIYKNIDEVDFDVWGNIANNPFYKVPQSTTRPPRQARAVDGLRYKNLDEIEHTGLDGFDVNNVESPKTTTRATKKAKPTLYFDEIDHGLFPGFASNQMFPQPRYRMPVYGRKRNIDEIDSSSFDSFFKRNLDEIDRVGWNSFVKRFEELNEKMGQ